MEPQILDLFSGAGGTALGFKKCGFGIVGAIDIDPDANRTYERNIGIKPLSLNLLTSSPENIRDVFRIKPSSLDVLVGCPPCQGFTRMRHNEPDKDERNDLVLKYLEIIKLLKPKTVVFENVPGILSRGYGKERYDALKAGLQKLDYNIAEGVLDAVQFGVPQFRKRIVLLARANGGTISLPQPTHHAKGSWVTVRHAIADLVPLQPGEQDPNDSNHRASSINDRVLSFLRNVPRNGGSRQDAPRELWLPCHQRNNNTHRDVYGRLSWDNPSGTMTSGCTNVSKGRFAHPEQDRGLTAREAALLQSFPRSFIFEGGVISISRQIGNAVPPKLSEAIANAILKAL